MRLRQPCGPVLLLVLIVWVSSAVAILPVLVIEQQDEQAPSVAADSRPLQQARFVRSPVPNGQSASDAGTSAQSEDHQEFPEPGQWSNGEESHGEQHQHVKKRSPSFGLTNLYYKWRKVQNLKRIRDRRNYDDDDD